MCVLRGACIYYPMMNCIIRGEPKQGSLLLLLLLLLVVVLVVGVQLCINNNFLRIQENNHCDVEFNKDTVHRAGATKSETRNSWFCMHRGYR